MSWAFYGRQEQLLLVQRILARRRWFFLQVSGRRRIGKTTLIREALSRAQRDRTLYIQIPDSDPAGVVAACNGYLETFELPDRVRDLPDLAKLIGRLARDGFVVALDEFQYFSRAKLFDFCSLLQAEVDELAAEADRVTGGLIVSGSLHTDMVALLEDRAAPLYNRTTDVLRLDHLDIGSVLEIVRAHADDDPHRLLFLWNLFEGVPKFYRDAWEQGVLGADRRTLLERLFFASSSPLRTEAENWFLKELRGRYDVVLQYVAAHPGASNGDIVSAVEAMSAPGSAGQVGGYLKILIERYSMVERRLPILAGPKVRAGRYYLRDNFLNAWLAALQRPVSAVAFKPLDTLVQQADKRLQDAEGRSFEELVKRVYAERSRRGLGDFPLQRMVEGYWNRSDVEIDLVAIDDEGERIRFGTCKRDGRRLARSVDELRAGAEAFAKLHGRYSSYRRELVAIAPAVDDEDRKAIRRAGAMAQSLGELVAPL